MRALSIMKKLPHNYEQLGPTVMDEELIYEYLDELLGLVKSDNYDKFEVCEALCELVQVRMSDNLCTPKEPYATEIYNLLVAYWPTTEEHLDSYLTVLINLGKDAELLELLRVKEARGLNQYEKKLVREIYDELRA
jgi:hypothetical protein